MRSWTVTCAALVFLGGCAGVAAARTTPPPPPGRGLDEPVDVEIAPPGASIGSFALNFVYQTASGYSGFGREVEPGQLVLGDAPDASRTHIGLRRVLLTAGQAAYASVDGGPPFPLQPVVGLPFEIRAAPFEVPGLSQRVLDERRQHITIQITDANGMPLREPAAGTVGRPDDPVLETRTWKAPAHPARGLCWVRATHLPGLHSLSGAVVSRLHPLKTAAEPRWLTCATALYSYRGGPPLEAWVLLDAIHPGRTPGEIPSLVTIAGRPAVYESRPGDGEVVARRVARGWLLVTGGANLTQDLNLLAHLQAAVAR